MVLYKDREFFPSHDRTKSTATYGPFPSGQDLKTTWTALYNERYKGPHRDG